MRPRTLLVLAVLVLLAGCHGKKGSVPPSGTSGRAAAEPPGTHKGAFDGTWKLTALRWSPTSCPPADTPTSALPPWNQEAWKKVAANLAFHRDFDLEGDKHGAFKIRIAEVGEGAQRRVVVYQCMGDDVDKCVSVPTQRFAWKKGAWRYGEHTDDTPRGPRCYWERSDLQLMKMGGGVRMVKRWLGATWGPPGAGSASCLGHPPPKDLKLHCVREVVYQTVPYP